MIIKKILRSFCLPLLEVGPPHIVVVDPDQKEVEKLKLLYLKVLLNKILDK